MSATPELKGPQSQAKVKMTTPVSKYLAFSLSTMFALMAVGCDPRGENEESPHSDQFSNFAKPSNESQIEAFCSKCHRMPLPTSFPKHAWRDEVRRGFEFYYASDQVDEAIPRQTEVQEYFVKNAPQKLSLPSPDSVDDLWVKRFEQLEVALPEVQNPAVSFLDYVDLGDKLGPGIILSEMREGGIYFIPVFDGRKSGRPLLLSRLSNPAAIKACDWNSDGLTDLMVADLGSFLPDDHKKGKVVLLRRENSSSELFSPTTLVDGIGRVSSVEISDLDNDGALDVLVAEFGWHETGSIFWLKRSVSDPTGLLEKRLIDGRSGAIHVPIHDFNSDGHPDFVVVVSQHHEVVELMINDGNGNFSAKTLYEAPCPSFGSSGVDLSDINHDGLLDILYTNGDSFDSFTLKPFHGVRWLENRGNLSFRPHEIGLLPGTHRSVAKDINSDGKCEVIAGTFIPARLLVDGGKNAESLVLWSQTEELSFEKHVLDANDCVNATLCIADVDRDGFNDLIVGHFRDDLVGPALTVWFYRGSSRAL